MEMNIGKLVANQVRAELEFMDLRGIIEDELRKMISKDVGKQMLSNIKKIIDEMVAEEVRKTLDGEVKTDDGWGDKKTYPSFEELFKQEFKKSMNGKWEVQREIKKQVEARVDSLINQHWNEVLEKITDEITKSKLVDKKGS